MKTAHKFFAGFLALSALAFVLVLFRSDGTAPTVPFRPVFLDAKQRLQVSSVPLTSAQADRIVIVLQKYGESYRRAGSNVVLITRRLSSDRELVWNYSSKSGLGL